MTVLEISEHKPWLITQIYTCPGKCVSGACLDMTPPTDTITSPANGSTVTSKGTTVTVSASANTVSVGFYVNNALKGTDTSAPYTYKLQTRPYIGQTIVIKAVATAGNGLTATATSTVKVVK